MKSLGARYGARAISISAMLLCYSCSSEKTEPEAKAPEEQESQESPTQEEDAGASAGSTGGESETQDDSAQETAPTSEETTSTSDVTTSGTAPDSGEKKRDCEKIEWGDSLKEGAVISRGDVQGFVDSDKDGVVEQEAKDAGMCQLHLTGKKCGLVLYSRRT